MIEIVIIRDNNSRNDEDAASDFCDYIGCYGFPGDGIFGVSAGGDRVGAQGHVYHFLRVLQF